MKHNGYAPLDPEHAKRHETFSKRHATVTLHRGAYGTEPYYFFQLMQWLHLLLALGVWVLATILYLMVFTCNSDDACRPYGVITFFATTDTLENKGWPVVTEKANELPATKNNLWPLDPYYTCMQAANIGNVSCGTTTPVDVYASCVQNNAPIKAALAVCTGFASNNQFVGWPTADEFMNCLFSSPVLNPYVQSRKVRNGFQACMSQAAYPFFEVALNPDSTIFLGSFNWGVLGSLGLMGMSFFAVYTGSPEVSGPVEFGVVSAMHKLGSFWAAGVTLISTVMWVISFCLFWYWNNNQYNNVTTGLLTFSVLSTLVGYFALEWLDFWGGEYTPLKVTNPFTVYKRKVDITGHRRREAEKEEERRLEIEKARIDEKRREIEKAKSDAERAQEYRNYYAQRDTNEFEKKLTLEVPARLSLMPHEDVAEYRIDENNVDSYASPLLAIWADAYVVCDGLLWLGFAGATGQLTTDFAWNMFTLVVVFRVNNANIARLLYECFHADKVEPTAVDTFRLLHSGLTNQVKEAYLDLKVLALALQFANVFFFVALLFVVYNPQQLTGAWWSPFFWFILLGFIIPESIRFVLHVVCQVYYDSHHGMKLLMVSQFLFLWDLVVRALLFSIVAWGLDNAYQFGTRGFLHSEYQYVMTQAYSYYCPAGSC